MKPNIKKATIDSHLQSPEKPQFEKDLSNVKHLIKGRGGELTVEVTGTPNPTVKWMLGRNFINETDRIHLHSSTDGRHKLVIDNVSQCDKGLYKVSASNSNGIIKCSAHIDVVTGPPKITSICQPSVEIILGENLFLFVSIEKYDDAYDIRWYKDDSKVALRNKNRLKITNGDFMGSLDVKCVEEKDGGQYKCEVTGQGGTRYKLFKVEVLSMYFM